MPPQDALRILLVAPRPEDESASLIDHRAAARALIQAVDRLGDLAELDILETPTFPALSAKIREASKAGKPFSVVHFDGHGVFDRDKGKGVLCFESHEAQEQAKTEGRATALVDADALAAELRELRVPLFFLDACQSAVTDHDPTASVAATLLENGVASVAAMSHSVLVTAAEKFAETFYQRLAEGSLIGSAMLAGQQALHADPVRMDLPDGEKLRLQDWFVPVLFQEKKDPQLVRNIPSRPAREVDETIRKIKRGDTPDAPTHGFVGRDRELLRLERLLLREPWAVLVGQSGAGKTTLAAEFARWMFDTRRFGRLAFVSFEFLSDTRAAIDSLGKQVINRDFTVAIFENNKDGEEKAILEIDRALRDSPTLIVLDNLESVLPDVPRKSVAGTLQAEDAERDTPATDLRGTIPGVAPVQEFTAFFQWLLKASDRTRLLLTTRERMPAPFHRGDREVRLGALAPHDALRLIAEVMKTEGIPVPSLNPEDLDAQFGALARSANYQARALTLLTRAIAERCDGLPGLNADLSHLMAEMERQHPGDKENSLFASIELSLRRLPEEMREVVDALAVFHGGADVVSWGKVAQREENDILQTARALVRVGLAEMVLDKFPYYFRLDPALPAYLATQIEPPLLDAWRIRWVEYTETLTDFLYQQIEKDARLEADLARLAETNLRALLAHLTKQDEPERVVDVAQKIESVFAPLGRPQTLAFAQRIRETFAVRLSEWGHARFSAIRTTIERLLEQGNLQTAFQLAMELLQQCQITGENAYQDAAYDFAGANLMLGKVLKNSGRSEQALPYLNESRERFLRIATIGNQSAERMTFSCLVEIGDCFENLGQYDKAVQAYEIAMKHFENRGHLGDVATCKTQLATARLGQKRYVDALNLYVDAKSIFEQLGEPGAVAAVSHQIGRVYQEAGNHEFSEEAYKESLVLKVHQKDRVGEASTLIQLGNLYKDALGRLEDAVLMFERTAAIYSGLRDFRLEGFSRSNLADTLIKLCHFSEARKQLSRAFECLSQFGHTVEPWKTWDIMRYLELAEGNLSAAATARQKAMQAYTAYRKDGGENRCNRAEWFAMAYQATQIGQTELLARQLEAALMPDSPPLVLAIVHQLIALLRGSRDPALTDDPELDYMDAVELRLLLEQLNREGI